MREGYAAARGVGAKRRCSAICGIATRAPSPTTTGAAKQPRNAGHGGDAVSAVLQGSADDEQARAVAATVRAQLLQPHGLATTTVSTGQQWDAPNGWAPLQWIAIRGLAETTDRTQLARDIAQRWVGKNLAGVPRHRQARGEVRRHRRDADGGGGEYPLQDGFGWTNGVLTTASGPLSGRADAARTLPSSRVAWTMLCAMRTLHGLHGREARQRCACSSRSGPMILRGTRSQHATHKAVRASGGRPVPTLENLHSTSLFWASPGRAETGGPLVGTAAGDPPLAAFTLKFDRLEHWAKPAVLCASARTPPERGTVYSPHRSRSVATCRICAGPQAVPRACDGGTQSREAACRSGPMHPVHWLVDEFCARGIGYSARRRPRYTVMRQLVILGIDASERISSSIAYVQRQSYARSVMK